MPSMAEVELDLIEAEYLLDSTVVHVRATGCGDIKPIALRRVERALSRLRVAKERVRRIQGFRQRTVTFDGALWSSGKKGRGVRGIHKWRKDCDV